MIISYLGNACFRLKGKNTTVVTDPYEKMAKTAADIVTISHDHHHDHHCLERVSDKPFVIQGPGEYEVKGVEIIGIRGRNTIYLYRFDELRLCHLGDLGTKLDEKQLEELDGIDVLMIPVDAVAALEQLEPKIVIPMHFGSIEKFLAEVDQEELKPIDKLNVTLSSLPEEREVVWLKQ